MTTLEIVFASIGALLAILGLIGGALSFLNKRNEDIFKNDLIFEQQQIKNTEDIKRVSNEIESLKVSVKNDIDLMNRFKEQQSVINAEFKKDIKSLMFTLTEIKQDTKYIKDTINKGGL